MLDDVELVRCFADRGDQAAFTGLVRRWIDFIYAVAYRRTAGDSASAADVTQNVFHLQARKAPQLTGATWMAVRNDTADGKGGHADGSAGGIEVPGHNPRKRGQESRIIDTAAASRLLNDS